ncbi:MAG: PD40 domain-containing protein [Gemmatimonadetes bacterium]|nr:PD40 domain-containing protein [Gemmatimonadota bacterium]
MTPVGAAVLVALLLAACRDTTGADRGPARLVFVRAPSYDTLFVASKSGAVTQRIPLALPSTVVRVSPRGDRLALVHKSQLWVTSLDGSSARQVAASASNVTWSPDGARLAYIVGVRPQQLRIVNADGGGEVVVPGAVPGGFGGLAWSPDGGRIAFEGMRGGSRTVYVINTDGSGLRDIEQNLPGPALEMRSIGEPTWSPDGKRLAFHRFESWVEINLWVVTLATGNARQITAGGSDVRAAWSPTGELIAFLRYEGDHADAFVVRPDGSGLVRITDTPRVDEASPNWLSD